MPKSRRSAGLPRFTIEQLRSFAVVARHSQITAAAEALGLGQGTISEQVRLLEKSLGLELMERSGRGIRITDAGRVVQRLAIDVLDRVAAVEALSEQYRAGRRGRVAIGCGHVIGAHRLATWLRPFVEQHPAVEIEIALGGPVDLSARLLNGVVDIAMMTLDVAPGGLEVLTLEETEAVVVVAPGHPLADGRPVTAHALAAERHLVHGGGSGTQMLARQLAGNAADGGPRLELEEGALLGALRAGLGWAVMPRSVVAADAASGALVILPHHGDRVVQRFCAVRRPGPLTPAAQHFWSHLEAIAAAPETG